MVAAPPKHQDRPFPRELAVPGGELQDALRSGGNLPEAIDAFCAVAFTQRDLALAGASFLVAIFVKDLKRLGEQMGSRHLADELFAGSSALCSLVSAYWDRKGQTGRLAELADEILSRSRRAIRHDAQAAEFIAALAVSLAIPQPGRAEELLKLIDRSVLSSEQQILFQEAQEWQMASQMLSNSSESERNFWQQELRGRRRNWFWDTDEGRAALRKLERLNPRLASGGSMIHRVVPQWAWDKPNDVAVTEAPELPPDTSAAPLRTARAPVTPPQPPRSRIPLAFLVCGGGFLLLTLSILLSGQKSKESMLEQASAPAVVRDITTSAPLVVVSNDNPQLPVPADAVEAQPPEPVSVETVVRAALLVPAEMSARKGWVKSPLGLEFQVTEANSVSGRITDPGGKVWQLPSDPGLAAVVTGHREALNPYTGEKIVFAEDQWAPGRAIAWGATGWSFKLPDVLPTSHAASQMPINPSVKKPSIRVSQEKNPSLKPVVRSNPPAPQKTVSKPAARATFTPMTRSGNEGPVVETASVRHSSGRSFVTRANSIRMMYKQGYWESRPGAYLKGAGETPALWARDMTLRERSSGTIPKGYVFEVADNGIVRVIPDPNPR